MKRTFFLSFLMLIIASPLVNAYTFEKYEGERAYYLPIFSQDLGQDTYERNGYSVEFPTNAPVALKKAIIKHLFDYNGTSLEYATKEFLQCSAIDETPRLVSSIPEDNMYVSYNWVSGSLISQSSNLIVYKSFFENYSAGAAHPMYGEAYLNYYIPTKKELKLADLFIMSKKSAINRAIRKNARKVSNALYNPNDLSGITCHDDFYLSPKGITFIYQPYEIGPFAAGVIEITVSKAQLTGCLTALGKKLIK